MADYRALAAVGRGITNLLKDAARTEFPTADFKLFQASDFSGSGVTPLGVSVYLYRIEIHVNRRNLPPRTNPATDQRFLPSLPLDLFYLITPWAGDGEMQSRLLGWAMRILEDTPSLPATLLNELDQGGQIFAPGETVEVLFDPLSLHDMSVLWEHLRSAKVLPSVTYVARMVLLDSRTEMVSGELAQTREFRLEKEQS